MKTFKNKAICLLISFLIVNAHASTRPGKANAEVREGINACLSFEEAYGCFPPQDSWLEELTGESTVINTAGCVFLNAQLPFKDPWGSPYIYKIPGKYNPDSFDFYSMGRDGISKTEGNDPDDISTWNKKADRVYNPIITPTRTTYLLICVSLATAVVTTGIRNKEMSKKEWHKLYVKSIVLLCILVPILNVAASSSDSASRQIIVILPVIIYISPIAINLIQRKWIFNLWEMLIAWLIAFIPLFLSIILIGMGATR